MTTNLFTDPQIISALLTVALTVVAAVSGYFLREWLTRSKPFVSVISIVGASKRRAARVPIPDRALRASKKSCLVSVLAERSQLDEISNALAIARKIETRAQELVDTIESFCRSVEKKEHEVAQSLLEELMLDEDFDAWLCLLIGEKTVAVPKFDEALPTLIEWGEEKNSRDGTFAIGFPGNHLRFGSGFNRLPLYKSSVKSFVELVGRLEFVKISQLFKSVSTVLNNETALSADLLSHLQEVVDKNSQWALRLFVANLGHTPFLIQTEAKVEIRDQNGGKYTERCYLVNLKQDEEKRTRRFKSSAPIVTQSQSDITFEFVTLHTQEEMSAGETIRSMFRSGSAECRVIFTIERPGHARSSKVLSEWTKFVDTRPIPA